MSIGAACMANVRRKFHDVIELKPSPVADEVLSRIGALYDIEDRIRGMSASSRRIPASIPPSTGATKN